MRERGGWLRIFAVLLGAGGLGYYYYSRQADAPVPAQVSPEVASADSAEPETRYPVPPTAPADGAPALPPLQGSDPTFQEGVQVLLGDVPLESMLIPRQLIERLVITIDSLDREAVSMRYRPVPRIGDGFAVVGAQENFTLAPENEDRYRGFVSTVQVVDVQKTVALYFRFYPLFEQSYRTLGKRGSFNDRLIEVIDHLLATPQIEGPISLVKTEQNYRFADDDLQSRSSGQKLLIRVGPSNAAILKEKLRQLRAAIVSRSQ